MATYLTDLESCQPSTAITAQPRRSAWRTVAYRTETLNGHMLMAGEETAAPEVSYPLGVEGWHWILLGLFPVNGSCTVQVRLTNDEAPVVLNIDRIRDFPDVEEPHCICEVAWKAADLIAQSIHFRQVCTPVGPAGDETSAFLCASAKIAYVKLVPLTAAEVNQLRTDRSQRQSKRLFAHNDAHGPLFLFRAVGEDELRREIEPYRNTDFSRLYWEMGAGDLLFHLGQQGRLPTCDGRDDFERQGDRLHAEAWRYFRDTGIDPLRIALDHTRAIGMEFHAAYRTAGFCYPVPFDQWNEGGVFEQRSDLRGVTKDGRLAPRLSYAYKETRRMVIDTLREVARHPVDGIAILHNRRPPLVGYEPPLVEGFIDSYHQDPRELADDDERWLRYRTIALTEFHRELRAALDELAVEQGRAPIHITACVSNHEENLLHGLDVKTLVGEGLIDTLIPYTSAPGLDSAAEAWITEAQVDQWVSLTRDTSCALSMSLLPRHVSPENYRRKAAMLYKAGVETFFCWDSAGASGRANYSPSWEALQRLGHRDEVLSWAGSEMAKSVRAPVPVTHLAEYDLSFQTPG